MVKILLIDDDPMIYDVLGMMLRRTEHELVWAKNGPEALEKLADNDLPGLVLCDIMMPGMDGIETLAAIRSTPRTADLPVAMITAHRQTHELKQAEQLGILGCIFKPFCRKDLLRKVEKFVAVQNASAP